MTAVGLILRIVAIFVGFASLGTAFEFPEVLCDPAPERFAIFAEDEAIIRLTNWGLIMTGFTHILIPVLLYHLVRARLQTAATQVADLWHVGGLLPGIRLSVAGYPDPRFRDRGRRP